MSIKIPVSADFDPSQIEAQLQQFRDKLNSLGQQISSANKVKFEPVSKTSLEDLRKMTLQFEALKRVSGDLNRRVNVTGQKDSNFFELDWAKMYPDQHSRARQMAKSFQYVTGLGFQGGPEQQGGGGGQGGGPRSGPSRAGAMAGNVAQAGLRAMGPSGGVAAGALGTGMSAGIGAGLAGLVGGIVALGVGKMVSAVKEKIGEAEDNEVAYDTLKRSIGDVSVSFDALKIAVKSTAEANNITYKEAIKLSSEFAKISGLSSDQYKEALAKGGSVDLGIGMSRGFGLDPAEGVSSLARSRGVMATTNEAETRRFALLIGETIGKSKAFALASDVMAAITDYTVSQTRANLSGANTAGFAGMYAGLVSSGIPGLDPAGANNLLSRVNASLTGGGAKGEASQFFTGVVGRRMGLDPLQTQMMREGGAFSTNQSTFGEDSIWAKYMGKTGPSGDSTHLTEQLKLLRESYGSDKGILAQATANHLGINMSQAMAMQMVPAQQMNEMSKYADITSLSGESISGLSKALFGTEQDRADVANSLSRRTGSEALSSEELKMLEDSFSVKGPEGAEIQKQVLAELLSARGQEDTQGKDIRDSKNALDNIKVSMAERMIPVMQTMRDGILKIAGVGKDGATTESILTDMAKAESGSRQAALQGRFNSKHSDLADERKALAEKARSLPYDSPERAAVDQQKAEVEGKIRALAEDHAKARQDEVRALELKTQQIKDNIEEQAKLEQEETDARRKRLAAQIERTEKEIANANKSDPFTAGGTGTGAGAAVLGPQPVSTVNPDGADTRGYRNNNPGNLRDNINWQGMTGTDGSFATFDSPEMGYRALGKNLQTYDKKHGLNTIRGIISRWAPPNENDTAGYIAMMSKELGVGPDDKLDMQDEKTLTRLISGISKQENGYLRHDNETIKTGAQLALGTHSTPLPAGSSAREQQQRQVAFEDMNINVVHENTLGQQVQPTEKLVTRTKNNWN